MPTTAPLRYYTVRDYLGWGEGSRCELIHGAVYDMLPAPSLDHQAAVGALYAALRGAAAAARDGADSGAPSPRCEVLVAPVDVVLSEDTVVQPDVAVVCDPRKTADRRRVNGAPELVAEVLSPATAVRDRREKRALYESAGIAEYLIVDPEQHYAEYLRIGADGRYGLPLVLGPDDSLALACLPHLVLNVGSLFGWSVGPAGGEAPAPGAG